jgi:hypothetical protein
VSQTNSTKAKAGPTNYSATAVTKEPVEMALIADGRSGSTIAMFVLANLTNSCVIPRMEGVHAVDACWHEIFGETPNEALNVPDPSALVDEYMDRMRRVHNGSTLIGFQFKTYKALYKRIRTPKYLAVWKHIADKGIRALYYTRNPVDEYISEAKHHSQYMLPSHCDPDDQSCISKMLEPVTVDVTRMLNFLPRYEQAHREVLEDMHASGIRYINTSYEMLIDNDNVLERLNEWKRVMRFLGVNIGSHAPYRRLDARVGGAPPPPDETGLTLEALEGALGVSAKTHPDQMSGMVTNWAEVVDGLQSHEDGRYLPHLTDHLRARMMGDRKSSFLQGAYAVSRARESRRR